MDLLAEIRGIRYKPLLCRHLEVFEFDNLEQAINSSTSFILNIDNENKVAISWWVSPKRTRSYPYSRVYDTLGFAGKKITIIPVVKDEGKEGDRDFLQWDTVSLMSLLGVYVIIAFYNTAERSTRYKHKITNQHFDIDYVKNQIKDILTYQSDALHWNLEHIEKVGEIGLRALESYEYISNTTKVEMHSRQSAEKRIAKLLEGKDEFMNMSRKLAEEAQRREGVTVQPKEYLSGKKGIITIQNYLGGCYYLTCDEIEINENDVYLIEGKHSRSNSLPSLEDIKDGLLKMILFTNLENVRSDSVEYNPRAVLKLTFEKHFDKSRLSTSKKKFLKLLHKEAKNNNFEIRIMRKKA